MSKLWYTHNATYRMPAGKILALYMDGIYIDGSLFENNIPLLDCVAHIQVKPRDYHLVEHGVEFGFPSFQNGQVKRIALEFDWLPFQEHKQSKILDYYGNPYGMGLNTIAVQPYIVIFPIPFDIIYDVSYTMEVDV